MKKISEAIKESGVKSYLICGSCKETFINDLLLANTIQCPNGCKTVLLAMAEPENLEEKIKKLEEELNQVYDQRNDLIDISQVRRCKKCKRFGVMPGYICFFCRNDPTVTEEDK